MEYKTITKPNGSEQKLAVYDGKCRFWMEGLYDSLPDTAEKRAEECSLPVKIDRREDGTVSVGTQSRTVGNRLRQAGNHGGRLLKLSGTGVQPAG